MNQVKQQSEQVERWRRENRALQEKAEDEQRYFALKLKEASHEYDAKIAKLEGSLEDAHVKLAHSVKQEDLRQGAGDALVGMKRSRFLASKD